MSYKKARFEFDNRGLVLIAGDNLDDGGSNGSGKSSVWDSISWALFGKTVRGVKDDQVINRIVGKDCVVKLGFELNGDEFLVTRHRKHNENGNRIFFVKNGENKELGTVDMTQQAIFEEIKLDFDLFRCTILFGQEETFNFVNETNAEQKKILSKVMKLDFSSPLRSAKDKLSELRDKLDEIDRDVDVLKSHIIEEPELAYEDEIKDWNKQRQERLSALETSMRDLIKRDLEVVRRLRALPLKDLQKQKDELRAEMDKRHEQSSEIAAAISDKKARIELTQAEINKKMKLKAAGKCPSCGGKIDNDNCKDVIAKAETELEEFKSAVLKLKKLEDQLDTKLQALSSKAEYVSDKISECSRDAATQKGIAQEVERLKKQFKSIEDEVNPFLARREDEVIKQDQIQKKIKNLEKQNEEAKELIPYHDFWVKGFGDDGIKSFVFDLICSTLTNRANHYLNILTGGSISITFDTQKQLKTGALREKFDCQILSDGNSVAYDSYSGGEKRRVSLAVDMALSDLMSDYYGTRFNIVIFDEQANYLDAQGRQAFMKLLKELAMSRMVFVVDHDEEFKAQFDDVIRIQKKNGVSYADA